MIQIYFAGALFSKAEIVFNEKLYIDLMSELDVTKYDIFLPQNECKNSENTIFRTCKYGIKNSQIMIAILEGTDVDSGTAWEIGYAYANHIPIIGLRTDFRERGDDFGLNCMISHSLYVLIEEDIVKSIIEIINDLERDRYVKVEKI